MKKYLIEKLKALRQLYVSGWCGHQWRFIGRRDTQFCNRDFIYECGKCKKYDVTHIRKLDAINDCVVHD